MVRLLEEIRKTGATKFINVMNLGEILYSTKRDFGDQKKIEALVNIERLGFTILEVSKELVFQACRI